MNGDWEVNLTGEKTFAGGVWYYDRKPYKSEVLTTSGPISEDIIVEVSVCLEYYCFYSRGSGFVTITVIKIGKDVYVQETLLLIIP